VAEGKDETKTEKAKKTAMERHMSEHVPKHKKKYDMPQDQAVAVALSEARGKGLAGAPEKPDKDLEKARGPARGTHQYDTWLNQYRRAREARRAQKLPVTTSPRTTAPEKRHTPNGSSYAWKSFGLSTVSKAIKVDNATKETLAYRQWVEKASKSGIEKMREHKSPLPSMYEGEKWKKDTSFPPSEMPPRAR